MSCNQRVPLLLEGDQKSASDSSFARMRTRKRATWLGASRPCAGHVGNTAGVATDAVSAHAQADRRAAERRGRRGRAQAGARRGRRRALGRRRLAGSASRPRGAGRVGVTKGLTDGAGVRTAAECPIATGATRPRSRAARSPAVPLSTRATASRATSTFGARAPRVTTRRAARRLPSAPSGATGRASRSVSGSATGTTSRRAAGSGVTGFARSTTRAHAATTTAPPFGRCIIGRARARATGRLDEGEGPNEREHHRDWHARPAPEQRESLHRNRILPSHSAKRLPSQADAHMTSLLLMN